MRAFLLSGTQFSWPVFPGGHQFLDGLENDLELPIIFPLHLLYFLQQILVGYHHLAEPDKSAHDENINLYFPSAIIELRKSNGTSGSLLRPLTLPSPPIGGRG